MSDTYNPFDNRFEAIKKNLNKIKLHPIRSSAKNSISLVECPFCGEFWQPHQKSTHEPTCKNPHKKATIAEILEIINK